MYQSKAAIDTQFGAHRCRETGRRYSLHLQKNDVGVYDGDLVLVLNSPLMMKGVDRNAKIVIDIEDKVTALAEKDTIQNRTACIMRSLKSLIGEISNYASCYHNKTPKTEKQKETYARYVDLLSITNGGFAVVKPRECLISSVA